MKRFVLAAMMAMTASQTAALSCLQPDVARSFAWASESEDSYVGLLGTLTFEAPDTSGRDPIAPESIAVPAWFEGKYLGASGFRNGAGRHVTVVFECLASWCGGLNPDAGEVLTFARQGPDGLVIFAGPCGGVFQTPSQADVRRVEACMRGEACEPQQR